MYGLEEDMVFNPLELDEAATPAAVERRIAAGEFAVAITMAAQVCTMRCGWGGVSHLPCLLPPHHFRHVGS